MTRQRRLSIEEAADIIAAMTGLNAVADFGRDTAAGSLNAYRAAKKIYDSENDLTRSRIQRDGAGPGAGSDDKYDAMRHAEASRRISEAVGPGYAHLFGTAHEIQNLLTLKNWMEPNILGRVGMDLRNNAEGRLASRENRQVDPRRLQKSLAPGSGRGRGYSPARGPSY